jgi:hypothetical protein
MFWGSVDKVIGLSSFFLARMGDLQPVIGVSEGNLTLSSSSVQVYAS